MDLSELEIGLLDYCIDDEMGLWVIVNTVFGGGYAIDQDLPPWVREQTMEVLASLLSKGLVVVGTLIGDSSGYAFEAFTDSNEELIKMIETEWDEMGRAPYPGDKFWIVLSEAGEKVLEEHFCE